MVGQCCLKLAQSGEETDREQMVVQLRWMHSEILHSTGELSIALKLAIEQLEG